MDMSYCKITQMLDWLPTVTYYLAPVMYSYESMSAMYDREIFETLNADTDVCFVVSRRTVHWNNGIW